MILHYLEHWLGNQIKKQIQIWLKWLGVEEIGDKVGDGREREGVEREKSNYF